MKQFNLLEWLANPSRKVVTRDGRPARILCTDAKAKDGACIIAAIETDEEEEGYQFYEDGRTYSSKSCIEDCADLFFADEEEELTEFEKQLGVYIYFPKLSCEFNKEEKKYIKDAANTLLVLAREELIEEVSSDNFAIDFALSKGKQDALKDLPKLEKTKACIDPTIPIMYTNTPSMKSYLEYHGYKLCINDVFEKLPKEE